MRHQVLMWFQMQSRVRNCEGSRLVVGTWLVVFPCFSTPFADPEDHSEPGPLPPPPPSGVPARGFLGLWVVWAWEYLEPGPLTSRKRERERVEWLGLVPPGVVGSKGIPLDCVESTDVCRLICVDWAALPLVPWSRLRRELPYKGKSHNLPTSVSRAQEESGGRKCGLLFLLKGLFCDMSVWSGHTWRSDHFEHHPPEIKDTRSFVWPKGPCRSSRWQTI